jgi:glycosyltransferase involved in cell wall biosynthesis
VVRDLSDRGDLAVCVIDDGSQDATMQVARAAGARVVRLPFNLGIGAAVQTGMQFARREGFAVAIQVDGDGQHLACEIDKLVAPLAETGVDIVVGSRFRERSTYDSPLPRRVGIWVFSVLLTRICHVRLTDATSGFRAYNRRAIDLFADSYPHDYPEVESLVIAARAGLTITEVPVEMAQRQAGTSSITPLRSIYYMAKVVLAIAMQLLRARERPHREGDT